MNAALADLLARAERKRAPVSAGPCTAQTGRCLTARDYSSELPACCRAHIIGLMAVTAQALNDAGVIWWADYGTLMGAVRNPMTIWADYPWLPQDRDTVGPVAGIVPHDKDADLGIESRGYAAALEQLRAVLPGPSQVLAFRHRLSIKVQLSHRNQTNVDLFSWSERPGGMFFRTGYAFVDQFKGREFSREMLFPLTTVAWEGLTLPAPRDPEAFLAFRYGPGWRTPIAANHDGVRR